MARFAANLSMMFGEHGFVDRFAAAGACGFGAVEYQFPWLANDMLHQVFFCDFGSVSNSYDFNDVRVSVGTGFRVIIPAFGPLPLAFDLAFPVTKENGDKVQNFNFTVGGVW